MRKKGFEYLIDALARDAAEDRRAGGDCRRRRSRRRAARSASSAARIGYRVRFLGNLSQDESPAWLATADIVAIPSVRDDSGNVDGLPNIVLETLASGTPLDHDTGRRHRIGRRARPNRRSSCRNAMPVALAEAILALARDPENRVRLGEAARATVMARFGWEFVAGRFESRLRSGACHDGAAPLTCILGPRCRLAAGWGQTSISRSGPERSRPSEKIEI